jgi:Stress responsive A/B Barrel Domain
MRLFFVTLVLWLGCVSQTRGAEGGQVREEKSSLLWHVVVFRFKDDADSRKLIPQMIEQYKKLQDLVVDPRNAERKLIKTFIYGINNSPEQLSFLEKDVKRNRDTEYAFILTFENEADRDQYVDRDPYHQKFKKEVFTLLEGGANGVFVVDFTAPPPK